MLGAGSRGARWLLAVLLAFGAALVPAAADAHPFGAPLTATVASTGAPGEVRVTWMPGASDDFIYLAVGLGLDDKDRSLDKGALLYVKRDADLLRASPLFEQYLFDHITVGHGAGACPGRVVSMDHIVAEGVRLAFDCPSAVDSVELSLSMMEDFHPAYRTLTTGPGGEKFVYDVDHPEHRWQLTSSGGLSDAARSALVQLSVIVLVLTLLAVVIGLAVRSRRHRQVVA